MKTNEHNAKQRILNAARHAAKAARKSDEYMRQMLLEEVKVRCDDLKREIGREIKWTDDEWVAFVSYLDVAER